MVASNPARHSNTTSDLCSICPWCNVWRPASCASWKIYWAISCDRLKSVNANGAITPTYKFVVFDALRRRSGAVVAPTSYKYAGLTPWHTNVLNRTPKWSNDILKFSHEHYSDTTISDIKQSTPAYVPHTPQWFPTAACWRGPTCRRHGSAYRESSAIKHWKVLSHDNHLHSRSQGASPIRGCGTLSECVFVSNHVPTNDVAYFTCSVCRCTQFTVHRHTRES